MLFRSRRHERKRVPQQLVVDIALRWAHQTNRREHGALAYVGDTPPDIVAARGVGCRSYWQPLGKKGLVKAGDGCHILRQARRGRSLWFNSHQWHKTLQQGFLLPPLLSS